MPRSALACSLLACALAAACASPGLPPGFAAAVAEAPEDVPARLWLQGNAITAAAAPLGPGGLPAAVRTAIEAIEPGGETRFAGREWGPRGDGYRIEKRYHDGGDESFRSVLLTADGRVLERSHSIALGKVPGPVLRAAMAVGRDVQRCEIVSDDAHEIGWRAMVRDGGARTFALELDLGARVHSVQRLVTTTLAVR